METDPDGIAAVRLARASIAEGLGLATRIAPSEALPAGFDRPRGVFVTVRRFPGGALRGCIGYPVAHFPLGEAITRAAQGAAVDDPRFAPLVADDLGAVTVEVSVLTPPEPIRAPTPEAVVAAVRVGLDGLIVEGRGRSGLLLPQVAPEQGWDATEFLDGVCEKAELPRGAWRSTGVRLYRFQAEVFEEQAPMGPIVAAPSAVTPGAGRAGRRS